MDKNQRIVSASPATSRSVAKGNQSFQETTMSNSPFPHRQIFSRLVLALINELQKRDLPTRNLVVSGSGPGSYPRIMATCEKEVTAIYESLVNKTFCLTQEELLLLRAVKDDSKSALSDKYQEACRILDILLPRYKDRPADNQDRNFAEPLEGQPLVTLEHAIGMFLEENYSYIRKRITKQFLEENQSLLPEPDPAEIADLEMADGEWLVNQNSKEEIALTAILKYTPAEARRVTIPRFSYVVRCMAPLNLIAEHSTAPTNMVSNFLVGGSNALFVYMASAKDDESDIEALDLFGMYRSFRMGLITHRDNARTIQTRLTSGKPVYKELLNLANRYYGSMFWGLEAIVRLTIPLLKPMFDDPATRPEVIRWIKSIGVLEQYQTHKRFHIKFENKNDN